MHRQRASQQLFYYGYRDATCEEEVQRTPYISRAVVPDATRSTQTHAYPRDQRSVVH